MAEKSLEGFTPEQIESMASAYRDLVGNPETRMTVLAAHKKINPRLSVPELDVRAQVAAELKARDDRIAALEAEGAKERVEAQVRESRRVLREERGLSMKDIEAVEKLMMEKHIPDYATAADFYQQQQKLAEPTPESGREPVGGSRYSLPNDPLAALKGGRKGLQQWGRDQAAAAIDDLRAGRVRLH